MVALSVPHRPHFTLYGHAVGRLATHLGKDGVEGRFRLFESVSWRCLPF